MNIAFSEDYSQKHKKLVLPMKSCILLTFRNSYNFDFFNISTEILLNMKNATQYTRI